MAVDQVEELHARRVAVTSSGAVCPSTDTVSMRVNQRDKRAKKKKNQHRCGSLKPRVSWHGFSNAAGACAGEIDTYSRGGQRGASS